MTDITELAQMKGQKVEGSYYLAECTDCGKMYPSNNLNGGEPLFSGDYGECYCPHCNADDAAIGDCGDAAATAWNYQQDRIDALVEALEKSESRLHEVAVACATAEQALEKAQQRITQLESRTVKLPKAMRVEGGAYCSAHAYYDSNGDYYDRADVVEMLVAEGIKVEAE